MSSPQTLSTGSACPQGLSRRRSALCPFGRRLIAACVAGMPAVCTIGLAIIGLLSSGCASFHQATVEKRLAAERLSVQGLQAMRQGDAAKAARYLREATLQKPDDVYSRTQLAEALADAGQAQAAIAELQTAIEYSPAQCGLHVRLGELYLQTGQMIAAEHQVEQALQVNVQSGAAWQLRGELAARQGNWDEALRCYQSALGFLGEAPTVQLKIAEIYRQQQKPLRALATLEPLAIQSSLDETSPSAAITLYGLVLNDLQQYDRAIEHLQLASQRADASPDTFVALSQAHWMSHQPAASLFALEAGQKRFPQLAIFSELIAAIPRTQGSPNIVGKTPTP